MFQFLESDEGGEIEEGLIVCFPVTGSVENRYLAEGEIRNLHTVCVFEHGRYYQCISFSDIHLPWVSKN
jgi:hypothetical protein